MKFLILLFSFLLFISIGFAQTTDTIYVEEYDTVVVEEAPVIINQTFYQPIIVPEKKKHFISEINVTLLGEEAYVNTCPYNTERYSLLKKGTTQHPTWLIGMKWIYFKNRFKVGMDCYYRFQNKQLKISDSSGVTELSSTYNAIQFGPGLGYSILDSKKWNVSLWTAFHFYFLLNQSGNVFAGQYLDEVIDIQKIPLYTKTNYIIHAEPSIAYKITEAFFIKISAHYFYDFDSNIQSTQHYVEQRHAFGAGLGLQYIY